MTICFEAYQHALYLRLGRFEVFAQRETGPATRYGYTRDDCSRGIFRAGTLDLPGLSVAWASI